MRLSFLSTALLCAPLLTGTLTAQERTLRVEPIGTGAFLVASSNAGDPNILVAVGSDRLVLVDGIWADAVDELMRTVGAASELPVRDLVLTHWHPDHSQGNAALRAQGITVWAHENAQRRMQAGNAIEFFGLEIPAYPADALADHALAEPHTMDIGGQEVRLVPMAAAHTDGDVMVHLPTANVLHMGDLQLGGIYPFVELSSGGDVDGLLAALDQAIALADESTIVIPGHGPVGRRSDLETYRGLLAAVWARVQDGVAQGKTVDEVIAAAPAAEFDAAWNTPLVPTDRFVGILYQAATARAPAPE